MRMHWYSHDSLRIWSSPFTKPPTKKETNARIETIVKRGIIEAKVHMKVRKNLSEVFENYLHGESIYFLIVNFYSEIKI
jgi:hypothetical protein